MTLMLEAFPDDCLRRYCLKSRTNDEDQTPIQHELPPIVAPNLRHHADEGCRRRMQTKDAGPLTACLARLQLRIASKYQTSPLSLLL